MLSPSFAITSLLLLALPFFLSIPISIWPAGFPHMPAPPVWLSLVIRPRSHFLPTFFPSPRSARSRRRIQACSWGISFWVFCLHRSSEALPAPLKPHPGSQPTRFHLLFLPHPFTRARSELRPCSAPSSPPSSPLIPIPAGSPGPAAGNR